MTIYSRNNPPIGFYIYAFLRKRDSLIATAGTPYYIGKGSGKRAWTKNKKEYRRSPPESQYISILYETLTEGQAFDIEKKLIAEYGRVDLGTGILRNMSDGGEGPSGTVRSDEFKKKMSTIVTGRIRTVEHRKALSNSLKGKKQSIEAKLKNSIAHIGKIRSIEHQAKLTASLTGRPQKIIICPHCNKKGGISVMHRHHLNNCKYKNHLNE